MSRSRRPESRGVVLGDALMRQVRQLEYRTRRRVDDLLAGNYLSSYKGQGIEFAEVRQYEPGDDVRWIDWNVTARTGEPHIKRFVEERQLTMILALDMSGSERFGTTTTLKSRLSIEVAAVLAAVAARHQDRVGLLLFTDHAEVFVPPRKGRKHLVRLMHEMVAFEPMFTGTNIANAVEFLGSVQKRRAVVFLISDFIVPGQGAEAFERPLRLLGRRHEVTAVRVTDPREAALPPAGLVTLRDAETGRLAIVDAGGRRARRRYAQHAAQRAQAADRCFVRAGIDHMTLSTERPFMPAIVRSFASRRAGRRR